MPWIPHIQEDEGTQPDSEVQYLEATSEQTEAALDEDSFRGEVESHILMFDMLFLQGQCSFKACLALVEKRQKLQG